MKKDFKFREIPYNYTSFSDKEIILKYFDAETWDLLEQLRLQRITGRSAKLLFEIIGDIFIIDRNPYIFNDFLENSKKRHHLKKLHSLKFNAIRTGTDHPLVMEIIRKTEKLNENLFDTFRKEKRFRHKIRSSLKKITDADNIQFSAYHKVVHVTDATDWRVEYPEVVVYPDSITEIPRLIRAARNLDLKIIPRGGGTGLTGGVIPVYKNTMIINTEKLHHISAVEIVNENGIEIPVLPVEAGVVTENAMHYSKKQGLIFATDPTSSWASTIGGNIAENAGGKKCVMWGTAIDNLYSFTIVNAWGDILEVKRRNHPYRKILPNDEVIFDIIQTRKSSRKVIKSITLKGTDIRKPGIGKDITNKALGGVPGIQKEGGDGIIVAAKFVLYRPFKYVKTICLEFFGTNLINASKAIVSITDTFEKKDNVFLTALEHFDDKYEAAINYRNKSERGELPKAVLLVDVESNDEALLNTACEEIIEIVKPFNTEGFIARDEETREQFWADRKNLGAIARHTNAFKLNEDVVIPIESLPLFADFIEKINIQKEIENNIRIIEDVVHYLQKKIESDTADEFLLSKKNTFASRIGEICSQYQSYLEHLDSPAESIIPGLEADKIPEGATLFEIIRDRIVRIDFEGDILQTFRQTFHGYIDVITAVDDIVASWRTRKIIIATHMHAGDGNVHVNIPVHSSDYAMMLEADETAGVIMEKTMELGGVISGEHGIGLTKLKFIDQQTLDNYAAYKKENDPEDLFNPGKLTSSFPTSRIYTPSLNLLKMEATILEAADLKDLTASISACIRCGKCKEVCNTHIPGETMFYSPRNKILGVSLITEAILYEAQTMNRLTFPNFKLMREIGNHCTMCHNCYHPCPVNIDFGEVTLSIKDLLVERKRGSFKAVTNFVLFYLRRRGYYINFLLRIFFLRMGSLIQRTAYVLNRPVARMTERVSSYIADTLSGKQAPAGKPSIRELLHLKGANTFFAFFDPAKPVRKSVVYFPGCGSERMFPEISMSVIALLYKAGIRVVIPPEYLCCGYPFLFNGKVKQAKIKSYENRVIFHRMADTINYMGIEDVVISCGTCYEMLQKYEMSNIFPDASVIDINEFLAKEGLYPSLGIKEKLLYHDPCHSPLKTKGYKKTFTSLVGSEPDAVPNCCGEGGTIALSTPGISRSLRNRKRGNILSKIKHHEKVMVITTCPSCVGGLSKINNGVSVTGRSLSVFLAEKHLGKNWQKDFIRDVKKNNGVEKIIL